MWARGCLMGEQNEAASVLVTQRARVKLLSEPGFATQPGICFGVSSRNPLLVTTLQPGERGVRHE